MSPVENFLDTGILVYAFSEDRRAEAAQALLNAPFVLSAQALNEFANVGRKKLGMTWQHIEKAVMAIVALADTVVAIDERTTMVAIGLAGRYGFSFYDAVMIAAALQAGSSRFYSEDLHHGLRIEDRLEVINPFR